MPHTVQQFLDKKNTIAVVGASNNPEKYGYKITKDLQQAGYHIIPINPKEKEILGLSCYAFLKDVPEKIDVVNFVVPPNITLQILKECQKLELKNVWFQPGASDEKVLQFCEKYGFAYVHDQCVMIEKENPKNILRNNIQNKLKKLSKTEKLQQSKKVIKQLKSSSLFQEAKTILLYASTEYEVHTHQLIQDSLQTKKIFLPKINKSQDILEIYQLEKWDDLIQGAYNILEPSEKNKGSINDIDLIIVPGVAFTKEGKRLGHGKGYYDKFLKNTNIPTIGLAFKEQIVSDLPTEKHDVQINKVLY